MIRKKKVWRKKFAAIAARDRQFTVKNTKKSVGIDNTNREYCDWKLKKSPQPKRLQHSWKGWIQVEDILKKDEATGLWTRRFIHHKSDYIPYNKLKDKPKMNHVEYMEKLTQHKLAKWERKHPKPCKDDDLFKEEMIPLWEDERKRAEERLRDFVVSIYDKLPLIGRFEQKKDGMATYQDKKIADLKDENGDGHRVNEISVDSKLVKKAQKITNKVHAKHANLICTNLKDHKRQKGRIILPQAAQGMSTGDSVTYDDTY